MLEIKIEKILGSNVDDSNKLEEYLKLKEKKGKGYGVVMRGPSDSYRISIAKNKKEAQEIYKELRKKYSFHLITIYKYEARTKNHKK